MQNSVNDSQMDIQALAVLDNAYINWNSDPFNNHAFLIKVLSEYLNPKNRSSSTELRTHCLNLMTSMCHTMLRDDISLMPFYTMELAELYCQRNCWQHMLENREHHLLSALLVAAAPNFMNPKIHVLVQKVLSEWTGTEFSCLWLGAFDAFRVEHKNAVAERLFGETWALLYQSEIQGSFADVYNAIMHSTPEIVFQDKTITTQDNTPYSLPTDL